MATGGSLLVEALLARGVDTVFALPGVQLDGFFDACSPASRRSGWCTPATSRRRR